MKWEESSYRLGAYTLLTSIEAGVIDAVGQPGDWNAVQRYVSPLMQAIMDGGYIPLTAIPPEVLDTSVTDAFLTMGG